MSSSTIALGSLWETPDWALLGTLSGTTGYDSNLTLLHDGPSSFYVAANPYLTLTRQHSDTDIEVNGGATRTEFLGSGQPGETDLSFNALLQYPNIENTVPIYKFTTSWIKTSQPNEFVGERVQNDVFTMAAEGYLTLTGKLGIRGTAEIDSSKFDATELNDSVRGNVFAGLAYLRNDTSEFSINIGTELGHSTPNDPYITDENVHSTEYDLTARLTGQITNKITGTVYGGFGVVTYTGGYSNRSDIPVGGADLTWGLDPRRTLVLAAYSGATNAPDGTAVETTHAFLSYVDVLASGWQLTVRAGPTYTVFSRYVTERIDNSLDYGMEIAYIPSKRFRVSLNFNYSNHNSDILAYQFNHEIVSLGASYAY